MIPTGAICISEVLGQCLLQVLDISDNNIGDDGITAIAGALGNSRINELLAGRCSITQAGARSLAKGLEIKGRYSQLILLDISDNDIGDDGIIAITAALSNIQIIELYVNGCGITLPGARSLAAGLLDGSSTTLRIKEKYLVKYSLQVLDISNNDIGDEGITAIAKVLTNSQVRKLYVKKCGFTLTGARSLATSLLFNNSISKLVINGNPITVEGMKLIQQAAMKSGICKVVMVENYDSDDENDQDITGETLHCMI